MAKGVDKVYLGPSVFGVPSWLSNTFKVPLLRWLVGIIAGLVLLLVVAGRAALLYKRRLKVSQEIRKVETDYLRRKAEQLETKEKAVKVSKRAKNIKLKKLKKKKEEIDAAAKQGPQAVADLLNQAFGKRT